MLLLDALRKSGVLSFEDNSKTYAAPTGFTVIDALGGNVEIDVHGNFILNGGLSNKFYMKTGNSGTGKTTLAIQTCAYGVDWWNRRYPDKEPSDLIVFDSEDNLVINRVVDLTGWNPDYMERHFSLRKDADIKTIYNTILKLVDEKRKNKDTYFVETDVMNVDGSPLKAWATTYILIDSMSGIKSRIGLESVGRDKVGELKDTNISENIDAMREAKDKIDFIFKLKPLCNEYGIYIGVINHITEEKSLSMFDVPKKYLTTLKAGEKIRGGEQLMFQAYGIDRNKYRESLGEKNPIYGDIDGSINEFMYIKSKNFGEGMPYRMIMSRRFGYMPELSDFEFLYTNNYGYSGSPVSMALDVLPEIKFSRKTLLDKCKEFPELPRAIQFTAKLLIINKLLMNKESGPDLTPFKELPYEERISYIYTFTDRYSRYGNVPESVELMEVLSRKNRYIDKDYDLSRSFMSDYMFALIEDPEYSYTIPIGFESFAKPYDDPKDFRIVDDDFWI